MEPIIQISLDLTNIDEALEVARARCAPAWIGWRRARR
jgi:3-keto-L-gulonate-6-phosphate decarboxylase